MAMAMDADTKNNLIKELTKILEAQDPKNYTEIYKLTVEMIKEYKHF